MAGQFLSNTEMQHDLRPSSNPANKQILVKASTNNNNKIATRMKNKSRKRRRATEEGLKALTKRAARLDILKEAKNGRQRRTSFFSLPQASIPLFSGTTTTGRFPDDFPVIQWDSSDDDDAHNNNGHDGDQHCSFAQSRLYRELCMASSALAENNSLPSSYATEPSTTSSSKGLMRSLQVVKDLDRLLLSDTTNVAPNKAISSGIDHNGYMEKLYHSRRTTTTAGTEKYAQPILWPPRTLFDRPVPSMAESDVFLTKANPSPLFVNRQEPTGEMHYYK